MNTPGVAAGPHALPQGIIAILRGVRPSEVLEVSGALIDSGVRTIEVPLNSPEPLRSIERLARAHGADVLVGAGTVLTASEVQQVAGAGARLMLAPNCDPEVVRAARAAHLCVLPGVATPSEGFVALAAGAHGLKLFPGEVLGPAALKAWRAVFPREVAMFAVGGVAVGNLGAWRGAGAQGAGVGSSLYAPGIGIREIAERASALVRAWESAKPPEFPEQGTAQDPDPGKTKMTGPA